MKAFLLTTIGFILCSSVHAQTVPTHRVSYGDHQADIAFEEVSPNEANIYMTNPNGSERAAINIKTIEENDIIETTVYDKTTGKQISHISGKKGEYIDSIKQTEHSSHEIHLKKTGPNDNDLSGTIKYSSKDTSTDIQLSNGTIIGHFSEVENNIKTDVSMMSDGSVQIVYSDNQTKEVLYKAFGTQDYMFLYDRNGQLIAEGSEDAMKIHNAKAYAEFEKLTEAEDDF